MTAVLGCIADDFTGGTDLAETLSRNGILKHRGCQSWYMFLVPKVPR